MSLIANVLCILFFSSVISVLLVYWISILCPLHLFLYHFNRLLLCLSISQRASQVSPICNWFRFFIVLILLFTASNSVFKSVIVLFVPLRCFSILSCNLYIFCLPFIQVPFMSLFSHSSFSILNRFYDFKNSIVRIKQIMSSSNNFSPPKWALFLGLSVYCGIPFLCCRLFS